LRKSETPWSVKDTTVYHGVPATKSCSPPAFQLLVKAETGQVTPGDSGTIRLRMGLKLLRNSTGIAFETVERRLRILADLDEVAVGITHVATPLAAVIFEWLCKEERSFFASFFVARLDVGYA
jgi:hypothetical protein